MNDECAQSNHTACANNSPHVVVRELELGPNGRGGSAERQHEAVRLVRHHLAAEPQRHALLRHRPPRLGRAGAGPVVVQNINQQQPNNKQQTTNNNNNEDDDDDNNDDDDDDDDDNNNNNNDHNHRSSSTSSTNNNKTRKHHNTFGTS